MVVGIWIIVCLDWIGTEWNRMETSVVLNIYGKKGEVGPSHVEGREVDRRPRATWAVFIGKFKPCFGCLLL